MVKKIDGAALGLGATFCVFGIVGFLGYKCAENDRLGGISSDLNRKRFELKAARAERDKYSFQERDLNGDGTNEVFYTIGGTNYFSQIDGESVEDSLVR